MNKAIVLDYLYLDLQTCDRGMGMDEVLETVLPEITPTLELAGC